MINRHTILASLASASALAVFVSAGAAAAQDTTPDRATREEPQVTTLDDIIVTARRRQERLVDVPGAATVIDVAVLENRGGASSAEEILGGQPSVRFLNTTSPLNSEVAIRGSSTARGTNADPSVGLYRNGAYIGGGRLGGRSFARIDLFDVGRIEVLRGTQGALYGRNAVGGAVNIISQQPLFNTSGFVDVRWGLEPKSIQGQGVVNFALSDVFAVRFGADLIDQDDGFFYNPGNDVFFDRQSGHSFRGQIRMRTGGLDVNLLLEHQNMDLPAVSYRVVIAPTLPRFPRGYVQDRFSYPWSTEPFARQNIDDAILTVKYDDGPVNITSTTFVRRREASLAVDLDALDAAELARQQALGIIVGPADVNSDSTTLDRTTTWIQDLHIGGSFIGGRLDWLVGGEYLDQKSDAETINRRTPTPANAQSPGNRSPVVVNYASLAAYGSLGYDFTPAFNVTGEARYTGDTRDVVARRFDLGTGLPTGGAGFNASGGSSPENVSYNLTAAYKITSEMLAYGKIGTSYRAGGFNTNLGDPRQPRPIPVAYDDETTMVYEVGLKGNITRRLYVALSGYLSRSNDLIVQQDNGCSATNPVCPIISTSFLSNAGRGRVWGIEGEAVLRTRFAGGQLRVSVGGSAQGGEVVAGPFDGFPLPQIADWLASADINYRRPFIGNTEIFGNAQFNAQWGGVQELSRPTPELDNYQILNLRAGVRLPQGLEISGFVNNVTNQIFLVFGDGRTTQRLSRPRSFGLQARLRF